MIFRRTRIEGLVLVEIEARRDERGHFARTWCRAEFAAQGLASHLEQASLSFNRVRGTLRGMHFQRAPHEEAKLVRCTRGAIYDVAIDLRPGSPTRGKWQAFELTAETASALYIPEGFAHGFQTLEPMSEVFYQMSTPYVPESGAGLRYDDPAFAIDWPLPVAAIADKDRTWPLYRAEAPAQRLR